MVAVVAVQQATHPIIFCLLYHFLHFFQSLQLRIKYFLVLVLMNLELDVLDIVGLELVGDLGCTVDHEPELIDD